MRKLLISAPTEKYFGWLLLIRITLTELSLSKAGKTNFSSSIIRKDIAFRFLRLFSQIVATEFSLVTITVYRLLNETGLLLMQL